MESANTAAAWVVVGADRDPDTMCARIRAGGSVVVVGTPGSGRSFLLDHIRTALERDGHAPLVIRTGRTLSSVPFGCLEAAPDTRAADLREAPDRPSGLTDTDPVIVIVDDADLLDSDTARSLTARAYRKEVVILAAIAAGSLRLGESFDSPLADLWAHGIAQRIDLRDLTVDEAFDLIDASTTARPLDKATRAKIVSLAGGSRALLTEAVSYAAQARDAGRDPLTCLREVPPTSRFGELLIARAAELSGPHTEVLATLGRVAGIEFVDAIRFLPEDDVEELISLGLVFDAGAPSRHLFAHPLIARAASRRCRVGEVRARLDLMIRRMLDAGGSWWSEAIACELARRRHRGDLELESPPREDLLRRAIVDAARAANDDAQPAVAIAYAATAPPVERPDHLDIEVQHASALLEGHPSRHAVDAFSTSFRRERRLDPDAAGVAAECAIQQRGRLSRPLSPLVLLTAANAALLDMRWSIAEAYARCATEHPTSDATSAKESAFVRAMSLCVRGRLDRASQVLAGTDAVTTTTPRQEGADAVGRLIVLCGRALGMQVNGIEVESMRDRLRREGVRAAAADDRLALVWLNHLAALVFAGLGDAGGAAREARLALIRGASFRLSPWSSVTLMYVARALALLGDTSAAREIWDATATPSAMRFTLVRHAALMAEAGILEAEGRHQDAVTRTRAAVALAELAGTPLLTAWGVYQAVALGDRTENDMTRLSAIAITIEGEMGETLRTWAQQITSGAAPDSPLDRLRLAGPWAAPLVPGPARRARGHAIPLPPGTENDTGLTRREREIAQLAAEGMNNREIAEHLYLSVRTVESHVYQARMKVGARSRRELGRMIGPRQTRRTA
ncbi:helix-turn-helix transcriptional regulator [Microbacterium xanthum]|uniref:helix-turn-helix transcriptional regulator n=1 Tax=Microbacterium xanthum TaxID=3079794 RepID=UPI002AD3A943|nr:LuxR C-terminal-related transcriptional regulator [Microbacterium sp. KSW-48]MDZ8171320.1 LuxR C-terminal-related transcriptional regulator [Microbacterium sp. KSW-48]